MKQALTFVEIDLDYCSLRYGQGACPATMTGANPTGDRKCFNTLATCQARTAFANAPVTLRFAKGTAYLVESGIEAIPALETESFTPPTVSLGDNLGTRASLSLTFSDFKWPDTGVGYDKYAAERGYNPFKQGTFWGKFRARHPFVRGRALRLIRGFVGQSLAEMETRHLVMESFDGPTPDGRFSIVAKDALKLADDDRAQAPRPSTGYLSADLAAGATSFTLGPAGIGNLEYPSSGFINIGGKEICGFTRSGDTMTISRGRYNTAAATHKGQDRVQVCLEFVARNPAQILETLFVGYAGIPSSYIPQETWSNEVTRFLGALYSALIPEPTGVNKLASEIVQQAGLSLWWDDLARLIQMRVLRPILTDAALFDDAAMLAGSLSIKDRPEKRLTQVWVYYGQVNPLLKQDETTNYRSMHISANLLAEADYGQPAVKKIYGRFIPEFGRAVAQRVGDIQLGQNLNPPRLITFNTFRDQQPKPALGLGCNVRARSLQTDTGALDLVPGQVTRLSASATGYQVEVSELRFLSQSPDLGERTILIPTDLRNFNWREAYDRLYPTPTAADDVVCIVSPGVFIGSNTTSVPAFVVGSWPAGVVPRLIVQGRIQGAGGPGGGGGGQRQAGNGGHSGGIALHTQSAIKLEFGSAGQIWGGGGGGGGGSGGNEGGFGQAAGGGGGGGGGGAGEAPGPAAGPGGGGDYNGGAGGPGSRQGGGYGGSGGRDSGGGGFGGGPGSPGYDGSVSYFAGGPGGPAGAAIVGNSLITVVGSNNGDIRGPRLN